MGQLRNFPLLLPPLTEQRRIAAILDAADALRQKRRQALRLRDQLSQAIFIEMFGDPVANPNGWKTRRLGDIGTLDRGVSKHRPRNAPELLGGIHPLIQTGDVANCDGYIRTFTSTYSDLGLRQSKKWPAGVLCITIAANIAKTGVLTFDACFPDSVVGFQPGDEATTEYVQVWLSFLQKTLAATAPESAQKNINLEILRNLMVPIPPIEKQQEFSYARTAVARLREDYVRAQQVGDSLFALRFGDGAAAKIEEGLQEFEREALKRATRTRPPGADPLSVVDYLYLGQLPRLLFADAVWQEVKSKFAHVNDLKRKLQSAAVERIAPVRNEIAHVREVSQERLLQATVSCNDVIEMLKT
jgi:hypothetical protein